MKYKLVALDMDGTLLNSSKVITERSISAIKKAGERGVKVCLSTGRPLCGVKEHLARLELTTPVITCNGALVAAPAGEVIYRCPLEAESARVIWQQGAEWNTTMCLWVGDRLYVNRIDTRTDDYRRLSGVDPVQVDDITPLAAEGISKILWYDTAQNVEQFKKRLADRLNCPVSYVTSDPRFLEFTHESVSKASALCRLAEYFGIQREQVMAIGDGENDLSMLEYAGLGVAMGNASPAVKARCGYITDTNDRDGAAKAIEQLCL